MKRYIIIWCSLYLLVGLLISCNDEKDGLPTGILYLNVEEDATLLTKTENKVTYESLQVAILQGEEDAQDTIKVYNDYLKEVKDQRLILPIGKYTIAVRSNGVDNVGWETPFYQGQEEIEVKQGEITNTKIVCKIANTKVSVIYSDSLKNHFLDYQTVVSNSFDSLTFTRDEYRSGYFTPEKLTVKLNLVNNDGNKFTIKQVYSDIKPQYHYRFKFSLEDGDGNSNAGGNFDIQVDETLKEIDYDIFIREEELFGKSAPKLTLGGKFENNVLTYKIKDVPDIPEASLNLSVPAGIKSLQLKTSSLQFGESQFDQTNWPADFPKIDIEKVEQTIDFASLIKILQPDELNKALHKFTLIVLDNLHQEEEITFSFEIKANVPVGFGTPVVWANFAVLAGESDNMDGASFLFRKKGEENYQTIEGEEIIRNKETGTFTTLIKELKPETTYEYKVVCDGQETPNWGTITTESAPEGVNMGFEDWCIEGELPRPWKSGETKPFWNTGNSVVDLFVTTIKAIMTQSSEDRKEGLKAVHMKSATQSGTKFGAGNIFTGDFKLDGTNGVLTLGREFTGRPSQLTGFYKYLPGTDANKHNSGSHLNGESTDLCSIYIALTDQTMTIHTGKSQYFDLQSSAIIAYGELPLEKCREQKDYEQFVIDLEYRDLDRRPKYIIIVASSSKYGDYFEGRENSQMWMDDLKLVYPKSMSDIKLKQ